MRSPRRIPHNVDLRSRYGTKRFDVFFRIFCDDRTHSTALSGQCHFNINCMPAIGIRIADVQIINKPQVHNVDWYLRVEAAFHRLPDQFFTKGHITGSRLGFLRDLIELHLGFCA